MFLRSLIWALIFQLLTTSLCFNNEKEVIFSPPEDVLHADERQIEILRQNSFEEKVTGNEEKEVSTRNIHDEKEIKGRSLGAVADIFLSSHCFSSDCQENPKRAQFCCVRNFNRECCIYSQGYYQNFHNGLFSSPYYPIAGNPLVDPYNPIGTGLGGTIGTGIGGVGIGGGLGAGTLGSGFDDISIVGGTYDPTLYAGAGQYSGGYISRKPGICPPAKSFQSNIQDLYFGLRSRDKRQLAELDDETFFLNDNDRNFEQVIDREKKRISEDEDEDEDEIEGQPNRFLVSSLTRSHSYNERIFGGGLNECRYDSECFGTKKCCLIQLGLYQFGMGCRYALPNTYTRGLGYYGSGYSPY